MFLEEIEAVVSIVECFESSVEVVEGQRVTAILEEAKGRKRKSTVDKRVRGKYFHSLMQFLHFLFNDLIRVGLFVHCLGKVECFPQQLYTS